MYIPLLVILTLFINYEAFRTQECPKSAKIDPDNGTWSNCLPENNSTAKYPRDTHTYKVYVNALGCMAPVCGGNDENELRPCPDADGSCGNYMGERADGQIVEAVDVRCSVDSTVHAPFDGEMFFWKPFGGAEDKSCADEGARIEGVGQWQGYHVLISSLKLSFYGGSVKKGEVIGKAVDRNCITGDNQGGATPSVQVTLFREGLPVDPTYHLQKCMCTGQICESNSKNSFLGAPFKSDKRFNGVRGWDIECRLVEDESVPDKRSPLIYAPIDGEQIGRTRLTFDANGAYSGCENDGIFIVGTGEWIVGTHVAHMAGAMLSPRTFPSHRRNRSYQCMQYSFIGYEARIYNVRVRSDLEFGRQRIVQGEPIATRLTCESAPDSIFLEIRYEGRVVDLTDVISAKKCQLPEVSDLLST